MNRFFVCRSSNSLQPTGFVLTVKCRRGVNLSFFLMSETSQQ